MRKQRVIKRLTSPSRSTLWACPTARLPFYNCSRIFYQICLHVRSNRPPLIFFRPEQWCWCCEKTLSIHVRLYLDPVLSHAPFHALSPVLALVHALSPSHAPFLCPARAHDRRNSNSNHLALKIILISCCSHDYFCDLIHVRVHVCL